MDRNLYGPGAPRARLCQWDDSHGVLAGHHGRTGDPGVCDTPHRRKNIRGRMLSIHCRGGGGLRFRRKKESLLTNPIGLHPPLDRIRIGALAGPTILRFGGGRVAPGIFPGAPFPGRGGHDHQTPPSTSPCELDRIRSRVWRGRGRGSPVCRGGYRAVEGSQSSPAFYSGVIRGDLDVVVGVAETVQSAACIDLWRLHTYIVQISTVSASLYISLHLSTSLCISLHLSASLCISLHLILVYQVQQTCTYSTISLHPPPLYPGHLDTYIHPCP